FRGRLIHFEIILLNKLLMLGLCNKAITYKHERITVKSSLIKNTFQTQDLKGAFIGVISLRKH
ncbi:hypothetical protein ABTO99_17190, partial [Acinetobacter baumannii]